MSSDHRTAAHTCTPFGRTVASISAVLAIAALVAGELELAGLAVVLAIAALQLRAAIVAVSPAPPARAVVIVDEAAPPDQVTAGRRS